MAASPPSALTRIPEAGHVPGAAGASFEGTLVTSSTLAPVTLGVVGGSTPARTVPRTVLPGPTPRTVTVWLPMAPPSALMKVMTTVYVRVSVPLLTTS